MLSLAKYLVEDLVVNEGNSMKNKNIICQQANEYDSFYLYDEAIILQSIQDLKLHFQNVKFLYSIKANANPCVVNCILSNDFGVDAASVAEVFMGKSNNVSKRDIQYSAPGKTKQNIVDTIDICTIIADSLTEIHLIDSIAKSRNTIAKIGVRLNPNFSFDTSTGMHSKFGIDEEQFFESMCENSALTNIEIVGLHIHIKSQELDEIKLSNYYEKVLILAQKVQDMVLNPLEFINMGSGIGIPYELNDTKVDIKSLAERTHQLIKSFSQILKDTQIFIETGRYAVGKSGVYVTKVLDKKTSHGKNYVILNNTLNGFIRPSIAQLITKYAGDDDLIASEPLYTTKNPSQIIVLNERKTSETVDLVGNLCTATDIVASNIELPCLEIGDIVIFTNAGSYSAVLTPMQFSSQIPPKELFLSIDGKVID